MADRVFAIDFGSAFTKVALRRDPGADAELLTSPREMVGAEFCIPSVAVLDIHLSDGHNVRHPRGEALLRQLMPEFKRRFHAELEADHIA